MIGLVPKRKTSAELDREVEGIIHRAYPVNAHGQPGFLLQEAEHSARE